MKKEIIDSITTLLDASQAREEKSTPGPWTMRQGKYGYEINGSAVVHVHGFLRNKAGISSASFSETVCEVNGFTQDAPLANAELIISARTELPAYREALRVTVEVLNRFDPACKKARPYGSEVRNTVARVLAILEGGKSNQ